MFRLGSNKFGAKRIGKYHSKKEALRAADLHLLVRVGEIRNLREQVSYELVPAQDGEKPVVYVADFTYETKCDDGTWKMVVEDVKSPATRTDAYVIKRKLMLWRHNIRIIES